MNSTPNDLDTTRCTACGEAAWFDATCTGWTHDDPERDVHRVQPEAHRDPHPLSLDQRRALCGPITFTDGTVGDVTRARHPRFALVDSDSPEHGGEYAWTTIARLRGVEVRDVFGAVAPR